MAEPVVTRILCIANQKGGVGKTTTALNLAAGLAMAGQRVLLLDLDPQCNATSGAGAQPALRHPLLEARDLGDSLVQTKLPKLALLPGSRSFRDAEALADSPLSQRITQHLRSASLQAFDFVLLDCPPSLGHLTRAALAGSTELVIPIQCEYFAMEGLTQMIDVVRDVMQRPENQLTFGGIVLTMYDPGLELTAEVENEVRDFFGEIVYFSTIPRDVAVAEAPSHGLSVLEYAPRSRGAWSYAELCQEVLNRE